jgi:hypothetical protein
MKTIPTSLCDEYNLSLVLELLADHFYGKKWTSLFLKIQENISLRTEIAKARKDLDEAERAIRALRSAAERTRRRTRRR